MKLLKKPPVPKNIVPRTQCLNTNLPEKVSCCGFETYIHLKLVLAIQKIIPLIAVVAGIITEENSVRGLEGPMIQYHPRLFRCVVTLACIAPLTGGY